MSKTTCDIPGCQNEPLMSWRPIGHERGYRVCRQHADRDHDPRDPFDLFDAFGLGHSEATGPATQRVGLRRFPNFGAEVRRPFKVHEYCYDCAEFYEGCNAWPANKPMLTKDRKSLLCLDYFKLPDVLPGEPTGQVFPPSRMKGRKLPRERQGEAAPARPNQKARNPAPAAAPIDPKRQCACGRQLPRRRRYCDTCRKGRRRATRLSYEQERPERSHHGAPVAVGAARRPLSAALARGDS